MSGKVARAVHRDLKPSNILVTRDGKPKVLDFGVARATNGDVQATSLHTASGQLVGTLPYMSPEQAAGKVDELDASSDVYALGVIGYELFSGRRPHMLDDLALHEAVRVICEDEPVRLRSIDHRLRGDVETIVEKALEKETERRYATADALAGDLKRYLDFEVITARAPGTWYQLTKFAKRNRALVTGVVAVLIAFLAGAAIATYLAVVAAQKRAEAEVRYRTAVKNLIEMTHLAGRPDDVAKWQAELDWLERGIRQRKDVQATTFAPSPPE